MNYNENQMRLLQSRYLQAGETPDAMFRRVSSHIARNETDNFGWADRFYNLLSSGDFLPNTPTLVNAGRRGKPRCMSACFVDSPDDNLEDICRILGEIPAIESAGGGIGWGLGKLRMKGDKVADRTGACGPVRVLRSFATAGGMLTQGAVRPGAHMAQLPFDHPDITEFTHAKDEPGLENVNISVQITDEQMKLVQGGQKVPLVNPRDGSIVRLEEARMLFTQAALQAHKTGDPGFVFIDRVKASHPNPHLGQIWSSNPCGEEFLEDGNSCNLGSINLANHTRNGKVDWKKLQETTWTAQRFLDCVIDENHWPFPRQREMVMQTRRIGLGVMGWADMLLILGVPYDDPKAFDLAEQIGDFISSEATRASLRLADEKGDPAGIGQRNSSLTTIAPTGSISILAGCSSGIEPHYALFSHRHWTDGEMTEVLPAFRDRLPLDEIERLGLARQSHKEQQLWLKNYFGHALTRNVRVAHEVSPENHVRMQAAWQKHIHNGVSKTVNLPNEAGVDKVVNIFRLAWELGCKAITVYRDGSLDAQVLCSGDT